MSPTSFASCSTWTWCSALTARACSVCLRTSERAGERGRGRLAGWQGSREGEDRSEGSRESAHKLAWRHLPHFVAPPSEVGSARPAAPARLVSCRRAWAARAGAPRRLCRGCSRRCFQQAPAPSLYRCPRHHQPRSAPPRHPPRAHARARFCLGHGGRAMSPAPLSLTARDRAPPLHAPRYPQHPSAKADAASASPPPPSPPCPRAISRAPRLACPIEGRHPRPGRGAAPAPFYFGRRDWLVPVYFRRKWRPLVCRSLRVRRVRLRSLLRGTVPSRLPLPTVLHHIMLACL